MRHSLGRPRLLRQSIVTLTIFVAGLSFDLWVGQWPHQICGLEGGKETCAPAIYIYIHTVYDCHFPIPHSAPVSLCYSDQMLPLLPTQFLDPSSDLIFFAGLDYILRSYSRC